MLFKNGAKSSQVKKAKKQESFKALDYRFCIISVPKATKDEGCEEIRKNLMFVINKNFC